MKNMAIFNIAVNAPLASMNYGFYMPNGAGLNAGVGAFHLLAVLIFCGIYAIEELKK